MQSRSQWPDSSEMCIQFIVQSIQYTYQLSLESQNAYGQQD